MTGVAGRIGRVECSPDNGTNYYDIGTLVDATLSGTIDELECTTHSSGAVREYIPNFIQNELSVNANWYQQDAGVVTLLNSFLPTPTTLKFRIFMETGVGKYRFDAEGFVKSFDLGMPRDGIQTFNTNIRLSGMSAATQLS